MQRNYSRKIFSSMHFTQLTLLFTSTAFMIKLRKDCDLLLKLRFISLAWNFSARPGWWARFISLSRYWTSNLHSQNAEKLVLGGCVTDFLNLRSRCVSVTSQNFCRKSCERQISASHSLTRGSGLNFRKLHHRAHWSYYGEGVAYEY